MSFHVSEGGLEGLLPSPRRVHRRPRAMAASGVTSTIIRLIRYNRPPRDQSTPPHDRVVPDGSALSHRKQVRGRSHGGQDWDRASSEHRSLGSSERLVGVAAPPSSTEIAVKEGARETAQLVTAAPAGAKKG